MRMKDTIRLTKAEQATLVIYRGKKNLLYMKKAKKIARKGLKLKHMRGLNGESDTGASNAKS